MGTPYFDKFLGEWCERDDDAGSGGVSGGALPKNKPFSTTVGGYTMTFDGSGGFSVYGSGASATLSNGAVAISANNAVSAFYYNENDGTTALLEINSGGVTVSHNDGGADGVLAVKGATVTANGSAITQTSSAFGGTSLEIDMLEGGVKYVCQSALAALSIGSAAAGCNGTIIFTVASGAIVTPPANVPYFGVTNYTAGSSYLMMINDFAAVCNEAAIPVGV